MGGGPDSLTWHSRFHESDFNLHSQPQGTSAQLNESAQCFPDPTSLPALPSPLFFAPRSHSGVLSKCYSFLKLTPSIVSLWTALSHSYCNPTIQMSLIIDTSHMAVYCCCLVLLVFFLCAWGFFPQLDCKFIEDKKHIWPTLSISTTSVTLQCK